MLNPPTLDGSPVFGLAVTMTTTEQERELQTNAYFGLAGLEVIDGGARGHITTVDGAHMGVSGNDNTGETGRANLALAQQAVRAFNDGRAHTLVDVLGQSWNGVFVGPLKPKPPVKLTPDGSAFQTYSLTLFHQQ